jgi:hypothetical protein
MTATWKYLNSAPAPSGELAWDHARRDLAARSRQATEAEIAQAVAVLLQRAGRGPVPEAEAAGGPPARPSRHEERVAARNGGRSPCRSPPPTVTGPHRVPAPPPAGLPRPGQR